MHEQRHEEMLSTDSVESTESTDTLFIHDMTTTKLNNKQLFVYCSNNKIDASTLPQHIFNHITRNPQGETEVVVIQCYECDDQGCVRQDDKHMLTVIGQQYTHYVLDESRGTFQKTVAAADEYDFGNKQYIKHAFRRECFFSENESNKRVLELFQDNERIYGNSHKFINEFCYDLYENHVNPDFKGRLIKKPEGFKFPLLMRKPYVQSETVIFGDAKSIQVVDDCHIKDYTYRHKTLSIDIETIMVDANGDKIDDEIIQISLVYQEGDTLYRVIGITVDNALESNCFYDYSHLHRFFENEQLPEVEICCVANERQLIEKFVELVIDVKPDYMAGYNILGFDLQVLLKAADKYSIDLVNDLSAMNGFDFNKSLITKSLKASRMRKSNGDISMLEDNSLFELNYKLFPGMLINDLYRCHKNEKLDELAKSNLGVGKEDVSYADIPVLFYSDGPNGIEDRSKLLKYNLVDSLLCAALINTSDNFSCYKFFVTSSYSSKIPHSEFFNTQKTPMLAPMFYYSFRRKGMLQKMKLKPLKVNNRMCIAQLLKYYLYHVRDVTHPDTRDLIDKFESGVIKTKTIEKHYDFHAQFGDCKSINFAYALHILRMQFENARRKNTKHGNHFYTLTHLMLYVRFMTEPTENEYDLEALIDAYYKDKRLGRYSPVNVAKGRRSSQYKSDLIDKEQSLTEQLTAFVRYLSRRTIAASTTMRHAVDDYIAKELKLKSQYTDDIAVFAKYLNSNDDGVLTQSMRDFLFTYKNSSCGQRFKDSYTYDTFCQEADSIIGDHLLMEFDEKSKYDGAYVYLPSPGVVFDKPIACLDFSAMYPSIGINGNFGPETIVSRKTIVEHNLKKNADYVMINIHVRDDHREIDIKRLSEEEANNYVCFLTPRHKKSTYCEVWEGVLNARLKYKRLIGTFDNASDNVLVKVKSDMHKIIANSFYGILPHLGEGKISACITSNGRQHIQKTDWYLREERNAETVYGDSVMPYTPITIRDNQGSIDTVTFEDLGSESEWEPYNQFKSEDGDERTDKEQYRPSEDLWVITSSGWAKCERVIRHKTVKRIYRVLTHTGVVDVTEDHSLLNADGQIIRPSECTIGTELLHVDGVDYSSLQSTQVSKELAYVLGVFVGDGSCGAYRTKSSTKYSWAISNQDVELLNKCKTYLENVHDMSFAILETMQSSNVHKLVPIGNRYGQNKQLVEWYRDLCYIGKAKKVPNIILNSNDQEILNEFHRGLIDADGCRKDHETCRCLRIDSKNQVSVQSYFVLLRKLGYEVSINTRSDKESVYRLTYTKKEQRRNPISIKKIYTILENYNGYVYDIETTDGTFNAGVGNIVLKNTDSVMFHFNMTYTDLCAAYKDNTFLNKGWISVDDKRDIDKIQDDPYKQACAVTNAISKGVAKELNEMYHQDPDKAIFGPPSKLEHEKVMLPFVIFGQKHYFAKIMDTDQENSYIIRGLEARKRNRLLATEEVEKTMFRDLLQRKPSTWKTYSVAKDLVSGLIDGNVDLKKIASRKKITVTQNRLNSNKADAGIDLFNRMKMRGEIVDTGGLDKITVYSVKVINEENKKLSKIESLDYLTKLQSEMQPLHLDTRAIAKQTLSEVLKVMSVIHPEATYDHYKDLLSLRIAQDAQASDFEVFISPEAVKQQRNEQIKKQARKPAKQLWNNTLHGYFSEQCSTSASQKSKRKFDGDAETSQQQPNAKKSKQTTLFGDLVTDQMMLQTSRKRKTNNSSTCCQTSNKAKQLKLSFGLQF